MTHYQTQSASLFHILERWLSLRELRYIGGGLAVLVLAVLVMSRLVNGELAGYLLIGALALLVFCGVLALVGLATGLLGFSEHHKGAASGRFLLDHLPEGVLVTDPLGQVQYANPSYQALVGISGAGREGRSFPDIGDLFAGQVAAAEPLYRLAQAVREKRPWQEEIRIAKAGDVKAGEDSAARGKPKLEEPCDGAQWYRISVDVIDELPGLAGAGPFALWQVAKITHERQRQEDAFGKLQEIIDYLDQAPAGFFTADEEGRVDYLNATLANWLGLDLPDAVVSKLTLKDIVAGDGAMLLAQAFASKKTNERRVLDLDLARQDGTLLPVRLLHRTLETEGAGRQSRTLVLNRLVDKGGDKDLRAAEVRFARFFHSAPIAIATIDEKGRVGSTNAAFARMFAQNLMQAHDDRVEIASLVNEEMREDITRALKKAADGQVKINPVNVSFAHDASQTGQLFFSPAGTIDKENGREFGGTILYAIDTSDLHSLEIQMAQGHKMQAVGQLAGGIAHDFNNLLTAIILGTDELLGGSRPTDPGFKDLISIKQNANRAAALVSQILAFSRRQTLRPEIINLNDVVTNASMLLDRLLGENVKLKLERRRDLWLSRADVTQFEQVIMNLAVNARDAMPKGGTVTISTRNVSQREASDLDDQGMQVGEYVLIQVADEGSGMTQEVRDKVFEPFFTTKGVGKGTGLGLSTVYGIVKQTGGFIYIDSELGKGTRFRIYLPRHEEEEKVVTDSKRVGKKAKPDLTGTETILLVEDEEAVRGFSAKALRKRGYEVFEAGTGVQALEVMNEVEGRIDLVVSDVMMPEMDGPTMAREMRREKPDLKIIFVSGYARDVLDEEDDFIFMSKPYGLKDLAAKVKDVLAS